MITHPAQAQLELSFSDFLERGKEGSSPVAFHRISGRGTRGDPPLTFLPKLITTAVAMQPCMSEVG
jgi:hypothetical protein